MLRRVSLAMAALLWLAGAPPARADEEVVELQYVAPSGCPARDRVEAAIRARTPNVRLAAQARRVFAITIEAAADGFHGTLVVDRIADKELSAPRCDDLATALALVTALAIDPTASALARPTSPGTGGTGGAGEAVEAVEAGGPAEAGERAWSFEADLDGMVEAGVSPGALFAAVIEGRATVRRTYQLELAAIAGRDSTARDGAQAQFTWLAARLGGCRRWLPWSGSGRRGRWGMTAGACGNFEVGAVRARGEMIVNQRDLTRLWLAAGVHASAQVPLGSRIFGQLQLGASLPLVRDRYLFAPNVEVHETPSVTGWLVLGVGVRFP
jgi:hypothetical protein